MSKDALMEISCWHDRAYTFEPSRTALLIIDMQRDFFSEEGGDEQTAEKAESGQTDDAVAIESDVPASQNEEVGEETATAEADEAVNDIVPRVAALLDFARSHGIKVYHTREGYAPDLSDVSEYRQSLGYVGAETTLGRFLIRGEPGHNFLSELQPAPGEVVIDKAGFSAFYGSNLDAQLRDDGIDHLIICGVTTQCCVHSTLREAVDRGFWCLTVADCCAAGDPELHDAALKIIIGEDHLFGWICDLGDVLDAADSGQGADTIDVLAVS